MAKTKYANQQLVIQGEQIPRDKDHPYCKINIAALDRAIGELSHAGLKLYLYLAKNEPDYEFGMSPKALENKYGVSKSTYYRARDELIELGYLEELQDKSLRFREMPISKVQIEPDAPAPMTAWEF